VQITEADTAQDEAAAVRLLGNDTFDIVLFDGSMRSAAGQAMLKALRAAPGKPLAIHIGTSGAQSAAGPAAALQADGVVARPIEWQEVSRLIGDCVTARLPKRVLLVDDSAAVRSVIHKVLRASRFRVNTDEADGYAAAVESARKQAYDVVILDCHMAGKDGFETLNELKKIRPNAKFLMITEKGDGAMERRARGEGAGDFLYKPFFAKDIDAAFGRLFGLDRLRLG
jgi:two-component system chemotaxis response regulator CheY